MSDPIVYDYYGTGYKKSEFLVGTEYEVEYVNNHGDLGKQFHIETDGSLRNNGFEYTTIPLSYEDSLDAFQKLFTILEYNSAKGHSERTSTHVHINVGNLKLSQVKQFILLYAALEPLFFNYVAPNRKDNIFCVPLSYTTVSKGYSEDIQSLVEMWHKYTAFNILPLKNYGTVEFRHLQGTNDFHLYEGWLKSLKDLYEYVRDNPTFDMVSYLRKGGSTTELTNIVPTLKLKAINLTTMLYDSTLDVKLSCGGI